MGIRFVTDSTADLEPAFREQHRIITVPLIVIIGERELRDGVDIQPADLYARMRGGEHARTSQPTPADFEAAFREATASGDTVICTTISAEMSGTFASAQAARAALPDADIRLVDTRTASVGHCAVVHAAVAAASAGADADAVLATVDRVMRSQRAVFTVETLDYLRRGGRIGGAAALVGSMLAVKPILHIEHGRVEPLERVRTYQRALDRLVGIVTEAAAAEGPLRMLVGHADAEAAARAMLPRLAAAGDAELLTIGPVVGVHAGPGLVGISYHPKAAEAG